MKKAPYAILAAIAMTGCVSDTARVKMEMERLVRENRFDDARNISVKRNPGGIPQTNEEKMRDSLVASLVNPEEARFVARRIKSLRDQVIADLKGGKKNDQFGDEIARKHIYEFGVIVQSPGNNWHLQPTANGLIFAAKCGFLNSRVNPAAYKRLTSSYTKAVQEAIDAGDYELAGRYIAGLKPVPAYPGSIDPLLDRSSAEAIAQRCEKDGVKALIAATKGQIYDMTAYREGYEKTEFVPDWAKLRGTLNEIVNALAADDVPLAEAQGITDSLLSGIKALFNDDATGENMTTAQLNDAIALLRVDLQARVNAALGAAIASAEAQEAARLAALQKKLVAAALEEINPAARAAAFASAIGATTDDGMNRILGDAARVMRLSAAGREISPADANSLLAASIYMGFADTAKLALSLGADINGASRKDSLNRTPLLVSLQFGANAKIESILEPADRTVRDANGYGAIHYAVRYADDVALKALIDLGLDAKSPAKDGVTPLMVAADMGNVMFAQALVGMSDVNAAEANGLTALHFAAKAGSLPVVLALVRNGADAKAVSKNGDSVLDVAVALPSENIIAFLLDDAKVPADERAIDWCVINGKVMPLTALIAHGGAVSDRHLAAAVKCGHYDMVKYLVSIGCDVNAGDVHSVFDAANEEIRQFLLANGYRESDAKGDFVKYL